MVHTAGGKVMLNVPSALARLAANVSKMTLLQLRMKFRLPSIRHCPLMSLPLAFNTTLDSIPSQVSYLTVPEDALRAAKNLKGPTQKRRIGLVWSGNPKCTEDQIRSMPLSCFEPLLDLEGLQFFSLQLGPAAAQLAAIQKPITDLRHAIKDLADTAALMTYLDLIITVDTSMAHLAGALAKPTWVLLPSAPDWRWLMDREDCPWYPTVRLFRQPTFGDWTSVIARLRHELTMSWTL